jgi:tetratricopeptide (TPR) repeat protein
MPFARSLAPFALWLLSTATLLAQGQQPPPASAPVTTAEQDALRQKAFAAEQGGRFGEAADAFLALHRAEPARIDWITAAGKTLGLAGRFREAVDLLDGARARFPGQTDVQFMLARTLLLQAERDPGVLHHEVLYADAAELAEAVLAHAPDDEGSRLLLTQARYLLREWDEAEKHGEEAARRHPNSAGAQVLLGRIAGDRMRLLLAQYEKEKPQGRDAAEFVGRIDAQRQAALRAYRRAAELDPDRPFPHVALGELAFADKKTEAARAHFADALAIEPTTPLSHDELVKGLDAAARAAFYAEIGGRYERRRGALPAKRATLAFHEGRARFDAGEWAAAKACFERTLAANPAFTNSHYYLFLCAWRLNDHAAAETHATAYAAAGAAAFADVLRDLQGDLRAEVGGVVQYLADHAHAQKRIANSRDLNHVIACLRDSADAWNNHAFLCRETGRFADAETSYRHALEKEPESAQLLNDLGVVLHYHLATPENLGKARELYGRALRAADKQLADARVTGPARERAAQAKADAAANLQALGQ